ncbi:MAG: DDE-type integrase/transposase/recombinase [Smithellaceae bacterium]
MGHRHNLSAVLRKVFCTCLSSSTGIPAKSWTMRSVTHWKRNLYYAVLRRALCNRKPEIINSDQGSHFTNQAYLDLMESNGVRISMGRQRPGTGQYSHRTFFFAA